jgi:CRISPR-associated endonuclease/helicase Cas3
MIVFFVSECEKKARKRTIQILDSFAERIGKSTWKARMTMEGLKSVKILLNKTASRHTSVACHRVEGYFATKLIWIVGNRKKFNRHGIISTNYTRNDALGVVDNDWHHLELIKLCTAIAGLFHDWGKAWDAFQKMLKTNTRCDPVRHEYVSLILWACFVKSRKPEQWLAELEDPVNLDEQKIIEHTNAVNTQTSLFKYLPDDFSKIIGWLIVSHHLQPDFPKHNAPSCQSPASLLQQVCIDHGYWKNKDEPYELKFSLGLPCRSETWCKQAGKWGKRGRNLLRGLDADQDKWQTLLRPIAHLSRTALMLGDHQASAKAQNPPAGKKKKNTAKNATSSPRLLAKSRHAEKETAPVFLDNHLTDVTAEALSLCHLFPYLESSLGRVESAEALERRSTGMFSWQDQASDYIRRKINEKDAENKGFLGLNMASTGTGKTFANAKIMHALQAGQLRYTLALGLRSLTLQTGDEYRWRIGLDETEMAVVIGSKAVRDLHESRNKPQYDDQSENWEIYSIWDEISYSSPVLDEKLSTKLSNPKARQILYSPVLVCTIDHVIGATEETKRGRHLIPWLRILSSDLVIDEVDDFDGDDLVAIMRLVHLAGMLGRKVLLSSATIPPAVAEAAYNSYSTGWQAFAETRGRQNQVITVWTDETTGARIQVPKDAADFSAHHLKYIQSRTKKLQQQPVKRTSEIRDVKPDSYAKTALEAAIDLHDRHCAQYEGKKVSFGIIRMANITPCVAMARFLLNADLPADTAVRILPYHSRFPRVTRHFTEVELDSALRRKDPQKVFTLPKIRKHLSQIRQTNVLFIVVATPIEELGRDHDFDWAVLEPSSIRSLIQMAGRVLRHRQVKTLDLPNVILLSHNVNALLNRSIAYTRPGYESKRFPLTSHNLRDILDEKTIRQQTDSTLRLARVKNPEPSKNLLDLEHCSLDSLLIGGDKSDCASVPGWNHGPWHLADIAQKHKPFRKGSREEIFYIIPEEPDYRLQFHQKDDQGQMHLRDEWVAHTELSALEEKRLWNPVKYVHQLEEIAEPMNSGMLRAAKRFGEIGVPDYMREPGAAQAYFNVHLGLWQKKDLGTLFK